MCAPDQSSIFSTGGKFRSDYGLLLELHTLTLVIRSYALLHKLCCTVTELLYKPVFPWRRGLLVVVHKNCTSKKFP